MRLLTKLFFNAFTLWHSRDEGRLPYWPLERLLKIQNCRVRAIVAHAYANVPFYREVMDQRGLRPEDFHSAADIERLPLIDGAMLARHGERFRARRGNPEHILKLHTTGTSGHSKHITYDRRAAFVALAHGQRQRVVCRHFVGRMLAYREMQFDREGGVSDRVRAFFERNSWVPGAVDLQRESHGVTDSLAHNIQRINAFKPDVIGGIGSYIGAIFRYAYDHDLALHRPKLVRYGGTMLADADRRLMEGEYGVPVLSHYQAVETLRLAFQCERRQDHHLHIDSVAVRVVDRDGRTLAPGSTGEIVISNLVNRGTVILNYRLGDLVTLGEEPCPCGRTLPTIRAIEGRSGDLVHLPDGGMLYPNTLMAAAKVAPGFVQAQLVQPETDRLLLRMVVAGNPDWESTRKAVAKELRALVGQGVALDIQRVSELPTGPTGKLKTFISHVSKNRE